MAKQDTHGLFAENGDLIASHPNGFSCHALAIRIRDNSEALAQADYIVRCGGLITPAGWFLLRGVEGAIRLTKEISLKKG